MAADRSRECTGGGKQHAQVIWGLEMTTTIGFAYEKLSGKVANGDHMTSECYNCHKCKLVVKHSRSQSNDCGDGARSRNLRTSQKYH